MPLLDHFHAPLHPVHQWKSFLSNWATRLADALIDQMPKVFLAEEHLYTEPKPGVDLATHVEKSAPTISMPPILPDSLEVRVFSTAAGRTLVGVIALVSPSNKDRDSGRLAFAMKVASYLNRDVGVVVIDIVTSRQANLHNEVMRLMRADASIMLADGQNLYSVAYQPVKRDGETMIALWTEPVALGAPLPTLPLCLTGDLFVPVDFEATYAEACRRRRIA